MTTLIRPFVDDEGATSVVSQCLTCAQAQVSAVEPVRCRNNGAIRLRVGAHVDDDTEVTLGGAVNFAVVGARQVAEANLRPRRHGGNVAVRSCDLQVGAVRQRETEHAVVEAVVIRDTNCRQVGGVEGLTVGVGVTHTNTRSEEVPVVHRQLCHGVQEISRETCVTRVALCRNRELACRHSSDEVSAVVAHRVGVTHRYLTADDETFVNERATAVQVDGVGAVVVEVEAGATECHGVTHLTVGQNCLVNRAGEVEVNSRAGVGRVVTECEVGVVTREGRFVLKVTEGDNTRVLPEQHRTGLSHLRPTTRPDQLTRADRATHDSRVVVGAAGLNRTSRELDGVIGVGGGNNVQDHERLVRLELGSNNAHSVADTEAVHHPISVSYNGVVIQQRVVAAATRAVTPIKTVRRTKRADVRAVCRVPVVNKFKLFRRNSDHRERMRNQIGVSLPLDLDEGVDGLESNAVTVEIALFEQVDVTSIGVEVDALGVTRSAQHRDSFTNSVVDRSGAGDLVCHDKRGGRIGLVYTIEAVVLCVRVVTDLEVDISGQVRQRGRGNDVNPASTHVSERDTARGSRAALAQIIRVYDKRHLH